MFFKFAFSAAGLSFRRPAAGLLALLFLALTACGGEESISEVAADEAQTEQRQQTLALSTSTVTVTAQAASTGVVCFYADPNYLGNSFCAGVGSAPMSRSFNNRISSVKVPAGLKLELFDEINYTGRVFATANNTTNLQLVGFNDTASSYRITRIASAGVTKLWSDPSTWGGRKPVAGAAVVVPAGLNLILDESTPDLGPITLEGSLSFKDAVPIELKTSVIIIRGSGALRAGSPTSRHTGLATITLTASDPAADPTGKDMGTRGILIYGGGKLELYGTPPAVPWTKLSANAEAAATQLQLADPVNWKAGDQIVVAPTEWYPVVGYATQAAHEAALTTERFTLTAANQRTLNLGAGLAAFKWGALQYVTDQGMSLTPGTFTAPHADAVQVLDERAEVGNLSRNIVIQGLDDTLWQSTGFGAQIMVMDLSSAARLDGVELRRVGQAGRNGRYPIHWHMLSYDQATGASLGDAQGQFIRNSSIWNSRQRCVVLHGTNGIEVRNNICYDIKGHAIFLEDALERRNVIEGNLVLRVRSPEAALLIARHEQRSSAGGCGGASVGYWLTNPDNTVRNNAVADAQGNGFWLSYPALPVKQSAKVPIRPTHLPHGVFEFNRARSNGHFGMALECAMVDDAGNTGLIKYSPTPTGAVYDYSNAARFTLRGSTMAKNRAGGYLNRTTVPDYRQFALAGNLQRSITGAVDEGTLKHSLVIGQSLNNRMSYPTDVEPPLGIASYHSAVSIAENTFVSFQNRGYVRTTNGWDISSGTFGTDDYYLRPLEKGFWRNTNNRLLASDPGYRALPPHMQSNFTLASNNFWTLAGALWDPQGIWGAPGRYSVLDSNFLRDSSCTTLLSLVPAGRPNGLSCAGPYFGVQGFWLNRGLADATDQYSFNEKLEVTRINSAGATVGTWVVEAGYASNFLGNMRHFAALKGDGYIVRFPQFPNASATKAPPRWVSVSVDGLVAATDSVLLGLHFDGRVVPRRVFASTNADFPNFASSGGNSRLLQAATSKAAVEAGAGNLYWQDTANNLVWIKAAPLGLPAPWANVVPGSDDDLYRSYDIRIEP